MNTHRWRFITLLTGNLLLVCLSILVFTRIRAQVDFADQLAARLAEQGVPEESVVVSSRLPFAVKINL